MHNPGNLCYINAAVTALLSLAPVRSDLAGVALRGAAGGAPGSPPGPLVAELQKLARRFEGRPGAGGDAPGPGPGSRSLGSPSELKRLVDARARQFHGNAQQDAHEFICVLLQALQEEVVATEAPAPAGAPAAPASGARRAAALETTADPAARNFAGTLEREMVCKACRHRASKREPFMHLSLDVPPRPDRPSVGLPEMLSAFFAEEELEKACEGCGAERAAHAVRLRIARMPRVLMLHLKRFQMGPRGQPLKVSTPVDLSHVLDVAPFCAPGAFLPPPLPPAGPAGAAGAVAPGGGGGSNSLMQRFSLAGATTPAKTPMGEAPPGPAVGQTPHPATPFPAGEAAPGPVELVDGGSGARAPDGARAAHRYRLHGLVSHLGAGDLAAAGHFITDTTDPASGRWTRHDDSRVYPVEPRALGDRTSDCYVLEYVHEAAWRL